MLARRLPRASRMAAPRSAVCDVCGGVETHEMAQARGKHQSMDWGNEPRRGTVIGWSSDISSSGAPSAQPKLVKIPTSSLTPAPVRQPGFPSRTCPLRSLHVHQQPVVDHCQFSSLELSSTKSPIHQIYITANPVPTAPRLVTDSHRREEKKKGTSRLRHRTSFSTLPEQPRTTNTTAMFTTRVLRQAAQHAERTPSIRFLGKRTIPG